VTTAGWILPPGISTYPSALTCCDGCISMEGTAHLSHSFLSHERALPLSFCDFSFFSEYAPFLLLGLACWPAGVKPRRLFCAGTHDHA
jgi:hypothetical protein